MDKYKPWMRSLLNRMKELYNKPNAKTIAEALPEVGSGGSDNTFKVIFTFSYNPLTITCDKTLEEIGEAYDAGKLVYANVEDKTYVLESIDVGDEVCVFVAVDGPSVYIITMPMGSDDWVMDFYRIQKEPFVVNVSGATPSIEPADNTVYKCGTLTSLTITNPPATGDYVIKFTSGATPTVPTIPQGIPGITGPEDNFSCEANTYYEINVEDNKAFVGKIALGSGS